MNVIIQKPSLDAINITRGIKCQVIKLQWYNMPCVHVFVLSGCVNLKPRQYQ